MTDFFTREWVESFARRWNGDTEMVAPLFAHGFSAVVALGYSDREEPSVLLNVEYGRIERAGRYVGTTQPKVDWDLRATPVQWAIWKENPLALSGVGVAVNTGQLRFKVGDYRKLMRTPELATAFLRFFKLL
jgi:hypothetical protein